MQYLRQSTAVTLKLGPFVDSADGDTDETAPARSSMAPPLVTDLEFNPRDDGQSDL